MKQDAGKRKSTKTSAGSLLGVEHTALYYILIEHTVAGFLVSKADIPLEAVVQSRSAVRSVIVVRGNTNLIQPRFL